MLRYEERLWMAVLWKVAAPFVCFVVVSSTGLLPTSAVDRKLAELVMFGSCWIFSASLFTSDLFSILLLLLMGVESPEILLLLDKDCLGLGSGVLVLFGCCWPVLNVAKGGTVYTGSDLLFSWIRSVELVYCCCCCGWCCLWLMFRLKSWNCFCTADASRGKGFLKHERKKGSQI